MPKHGQRGLFERMGNGEIVHADCLEHLRSMPDASVEALVTDPPAGISFMGKSWDGDKGGRDEWVRWLSEVMKECRRVLKPGAHALVWAIPRTSHWTATAIEDAGFEIRDNIFHLFGVGFPKSMNVEKALDKKGELCQCPENEKTKAKAGLSELRDNVPTKEQNSPIESEVLQREVQRCREGIESGVCCSPTGDCTQRPCRMESGYGAPVQKENAGREKPGVDRGALSRTGQGLHNGPQSKTPEGETERLRLRTHSSDGADDRAQASQGRGGAPHQSQAGRQSPGESPALQDTSRALVSAPQSRLHCGQCGKVKKSEVAGLGTALKPSVEVWILARNPCSEKTVAANVLEHGTGALNIDGCRIGYQDEKDAKEGRSARATESKGQFAGLKEKSDEFDRSDRSQITGRFPANLILSHSPECVEVGVKKVKAIKGGNSTNIGGFVTAHADKEKIGKPCGFGDSDGTETVPDFRCAPGCAVAELDRQSGILKPGGQRSCGSKNATSQFGIGIDIERRSKFSDSGGASRFFLCATYDKSELCGLGSTKDADTSAGKKTENKSDSLSIDGCGSKFTDQFLMGTISITGMGTHSIITFPILSASTKTCIGTITIESGKTIEKSLAESVVGVSVASATEACLYFQNGQQEPITGIVSLASESTLLDGVIKTVNTGTRTIGHIAPSRFFYCAKVSPSERNAGCEALPEGPAPGSKRSTPAEGRESALGKPRTNHHPTVKPLKLMRYLIRLITPPGGTVLDPFPGSGSTGVAAIQEGFNFVGIEREDEYVAIARARLNHAAFG